MNDTYAFPCFRQCGWEKREWSRHKGSSVFLAIWLHLYLSPPRFCLCARFGFFYSNFFLMLRASRLVSRLEYKYSRALIASFCLQLKFTIHLLVSHIRSTASQKRCSSKTVCIHPWMHTVVYILCNSAAVVLLVTWCTEVLMRTSVVWKW